MIFEDLPAAVRTAFFSHGVDGLCDCVKTDLLPDGTYGAVWTGFDFEFLYLLYGRERIGGKRRDPQHPAVFFSETGFERISLSETENFRVERFFTTARLVCDRNGTPCELSRFSLGCANRVSKFLRGMNRSEEGAKDDFPDARKPEKPKNRKSALLRLFGLFGQYGRYLWKYFAVLLLSTVFGLLSPYVGTRLLYDRVLSEQDPWFGQVGMFLLMLIGVRLAALGFSILEKKFFSADLAPRLTYDLKTRIFRAMQRLSLGFYTDKQTGALMNRVYDDTESVYDFFVYIVPYAVVNGISILGILGILLNISFPLGLGVLCTAPLLSIGYWSVSRFFRRLHHRRWVYRSAMVSQVSDTVTGQRIVKAFSKEEEETARFAGYSDRMRRSALQLMNLQDTLFPAVSMITVLINMGALAAGGLLILQDNGFTLGLLMTFTTYLNLLYSPLESISRIAGDLMRCLDSAERIFEIIDAEPEVEDAPDAVRMPEMKGEIELKNVLFEYEPGRPVIRDLSLKVEAGRTVGIVGKTGAGKSTVVNLIARLYDVSEGEIRIDGVPVRKIAIQDLRKNIGIVSQEIYLFAGTVADNIRYARPEASEEEVIAAAKAAAAHEFILRLPDGYETRVGVGGQDLSGGERQRISIARAILQNPKILILDEATASMDTVTERKIQQALTDLQKGRTTVSVAHRLSTLRDADCLAVVSDGRMTEYGTHDELIRKKGEYYELYRLQAEAMEKIAIAE